MANEPATEGVTAEPLFTVTGLGSGAEAGVFAPRSVDEIEDFLRTEQAFWQWLLESQYGDHVVATTRSRQFWQDSEIVGMLSQYKSNPEGHPDLPRQIGARIASRYAEQRAIHSSSPRAKLVADIAKQDQRMAAATAMSLSGDNPPGPDRYSIMGAALAAQHLYGVGNPPENFKTAWSDVRKTVATEHENLRRAAGAAADEWTSRRDAIVELHNRQSEAFESGQKARVIAFDSLMGEHNKKVTNIEDAFKSHMALRASVKYFSDKASEHDRASKLFAKFSGAVALVAAAAVVVLGALVFGKGEATHTQIGVTLVLGFLVLWLLRLLVRILLSNLHLATDMKNRATLVQAYLALIAEGAALKDEDRGQIVSLVFRPTSDGLVKDDAAPPTLGSFVQNMMSR